VVDDTGALSRSRVVTGWLLALVGAPALTAALLPFRRDNALSYEAMLFLGLAVAVALVGGRWPAVAASLAGCLLLNYFFTAPLHTLSIAAPENILALAVLLVTSLAVATLVDSAARRRHQAQLAQREAETLSMLNRTALGGELGLDRLLLLVRDTFDADVVELVDPGTEPPPSAGDTVAPAGGSWVLVVRGRVLDGVERRIMQAFASHLGVLREREEMARQAEAARELEAGNRTRTALLAAVSHDLRTPLAEIRAATETLRISSAVLDADDRATLLATVETATARLTTIVTDLLDMSRLQTGAVQPMTVSTSLDQVLAAATHGLPDGSLVDVAPGLPAVVADPGLLERVVENLLTNAVRHAGGAQVTAEAHDHRVRVLVVDPGPGVPESDRTRMFEPFQRLGDTTAGEGVGLGLAVARGLAEAQGGTLRVSDTPGGGLTMVLELPAP
jgi:two-component system sensor histidine kinase KdpD